MTKHLRSQKVSHLRIPPYMVGNAQLAVALVVNRPILSGLVVVGLELVINKGTSIMDLNTPKIIIGEHIAMGVVTLIICCLIVPIRLVLK